MQSMDNKFLKELKFHYPPDEELKCTNYYQIFKFIQQLSLKNIYFSIKMYDLPQSSFLFSLFVGTYPFLNNNSKQHSLWFRQARPCTD